MAPADDANPETPSTGSAEPQIAPQRGSFFSRGAEYVRKKRTTIWVALISVTGTLVVLAAAVLGWRLYGQWRTGRVEFTTDGEAVVAQVLPEDSDTPIGAPFDLATRAVVELPDGDYRLRVNGKGRLSRTFRFAVNRGETQAHSVSIDEGRLLRPDLEASERDAESSTANLFGHEDDPKTRPRAAPIPFATVSTALELTAGKADLIELRNGSLVRRDGATGKVIWKLSVPTTPLGRDRDLASLLRFFFSSDVFRSGFVQQAPDLNGDGTGDVVVFSQTHAAVMALSGCDGSLIWNCFAKEDGSGGPIRGARVWSGVNLPVKPGPRALGSAQVEWIEARVIEAGGAPAIVACYRDPASGGISLARVAGRDGRMVWSSPLPDDTTLPLTPDEAERFCADLNGDGALDVLMLLRNRGARLGREYTLCAISLADGAQRWTQKLSSEELSSPEVKIGDVAGDGLPDVVVLDRVAETQQILRVFDGRDGAARWTWAPPNDAPSYLEPIHIAVANFAEAIGRNVCVSFVGKNGAYHIGVLDRNGREQSRRVLDRSAIRSLASADLDGDGRDELLLYYDGFLRAWDHELKERWFWPAPSGKIEQVIPASRETAALVVLPGGLSLDGATGQPRWTGQAPLTRSPQQSALRLLDPGDAKRLPRMLSDELGATVCRVAMPTLADGSIVSLWGERVKPGRIPTDPRWARRLPWVTRLTGALRPENFYASAGLALVNFVLPLSIWRWAKGNRRYFHIRALMVLPLAAAIPLMTYLSVLPWMPDELMPVLTTEGRIFLAGTLAGIPLVYYVAVMAASAIQRRWRALIALLGITAIVGVITAAGWIILDRRSMAAIEHYQLDGWERILLLAAYCTAVVWGMVKAGLGVYGLARRRAPRIENITLCHVSP